MDIFYQILSVVGIGGIIGIGIWVGIIQTKVKEYDKFTASSREDHTKISNHEELLSSVKSDHDLLIEIKTKLDMLLQRNLNVS
jgi:hypothetical protein